jgi:Cu/Ag efflux protein CusF
MGFRARDHAMMTGLVSGDRIEFKLARGGDDFVLVELQKENDGSLGR